MSVSAIDLRLLCQCRRWPGKWVCEYRATAEDMLCDTCRPGCASQAFLAAEDVHLHLPSSGAINWDDLDGDLPWATR